MKILVPVDGSKYSIEALKVAIDYAKAKSAEITVISVAADNSGVDLEISAGERERMNERLERQASAVIKDACDLIAKETVKSDCKVVIAFSSVADAILSTADKEKSTLIVMGSKGLSQSSRFKMGSVASQVVKYSDCSVYVVKMAG
ncbi:MAG TPA: universal stress protein [Dissulfurispiraceae bacterium]|nr:universal stress protein [Dissulfurispiraceae bacterium]